MLAGDVTTDGGVVHLVGGGEGEDVRGARHTPGGGAGAVADGELLKVQPGENMINMTIMVGQVVRWSGHLI